MLRVREVTGPTTATVGDHVRYRVTRFNEANPAPDLTAGVSWLVKTPSAAALAHVARGGPELQLRVPSTWAGQTAIVMPYMTSPSAAIAVRTIIAPRQGAPPLSDGRHVEVIREQGRYYASIDGEPRFYLGVDVRYGDRRGLMNSNNPPGSRYQPQQYETPHGDWAWYLAPTILCESKGHYTCLNTYDRASFTFGHIQLGAHTPDDNFVAFFREILAQPAAVEYFPDLTVVDGRIHRLTDTGVVPLETASTTAPLMAYLNATPREVDTIEAERAARLVDWSLRHSPMRDAQVAFSVREQKEKLARHARALPLEGVVDKLCIVVLDILHQGRGKYTAIRAALAADDPFDALLAIGASQYRERISTLRAAIKDLEVDGRVGQKAYEAESGDFVAPSDV